MKPDFTPSDDHEALDDEPCICGHDIQRHNAKLFRSINGDEWDATDCRMCECMMYEWDEDAGSDF